MYNTERSSTTQGISPLRRLLAGLALIAALAAAVLLTADFNGGPLANASAPARDSGHGDDKSKDKDKTAKGSDEEEDDDDSDDDSDSDDSDDNSDSDSDDSDDNSDSDSDDSDLGWDSDSDDSDDDSSGSEDDLPPAYTDCAPAKTVQPFAPWGDLNEYAEVVNGSFEDGLTGWEAKGKEPSVVQSDRGAVLQVGGGTKVLSPEICFDETRPHARMFTHILEGHRETGKVEVEVHYDRVKGGVEKIDVGSFGQDASSKTEWTPSPELKTALGGVRKHVEPDKNGNRWFQFEFKVKGKATWQLDDLFVDPRRRS